jgi:hypothetical protein
MEADGALGLYSALRAHSLVGWALGSALEGMGDAGLPVVKRRLSWARATAGEGSQSLMCTAQAAVVLLGLAVRAPTGIPWLDPVIALAWPRGRWASSGKPGRARTAADRAALSEGVGTGGDRSAPRPALSRTGLIGGH